MLTPIIAPSTAHLRSVLDGRLEGLRRAAQALFDEAGGARGLENLFQAHGLGHLPQAWAQGHAHVLPPHQLHTLIGREQLARLAQLADLSLAQTLAGLSDYLPNYFAHEHEFNAAGNSWDEAALP